MKELLKNPVFYYIAIPILAAFWPLLLSAAYLPATREKLQKKTQEYEKMETQIKKILTIDPDRLEYARAKSKTGDFDYANAVEQIAVTCGISASNYKLSSSMIIKSRAGQKTQDARITLNNINIEKFAKFISTIQLRWPSLQCTQLKLTKLKEAPDLWKVDIQFKYYY